MTITVKQLSAFFDDVASGNAKGYWVYRGDKKIAFSYMKEQAENIASAYPGSEIKEVNV